MTLKQILYLEAIKEAGSITQAAQNLFIAQSSLSQAVHDVEREYGFTIFDRNSKGITLTHQGAEFLNDIQHIALFYRNIENKYKEISNDRERLYVCAHHHIIGLDAFRKLLSKLGESSYRLGYRNGNTVQILDLLESNQYDIGLVFCVNSSRTALLKEIDKRALSFQHLQYSRIHAYMYKSHPLAGKSSLHLNEITQYPYISYDDESDISSSKYTNSILQWNNNNQVLAVSDRATAYYLLSCLPAYTTGSGYLSEDEKNRGIVAIPIDGMESIEIGWIKQRNRLLPEIAMEYIDILTKDSEAMRKT